MNIEELNKLSLAIVNDVANNKHLEPEEIKNLGSLKAAKILKTTFKKMVKVFNDRARLCYNEYLRGLKNNIDNPNFLVSTNLYSKCASFYREEIDTLNGMISEFYEYMLCGNIISTLLGKEREDHE